MKYSLETRVNRLKEHLRRKPSDTQAQRKLFVLLGRYEEWKRSTAYSMQEMLKRVYTDENIPSNRGYFTSGFFSTLTKAEPFEATSFTYPVVLKCKS